MTQRSASCGYLGQVSLQTVLGVCRLRDTVGEWHVYGVKLVPHLVWSGIEQNLNLIAEFVRCGALALRMQDVVVGELRPGVWKTDTVETIKKVNYNIDLLLRKILKTDSYHSLDWNKIKLTMGPGDRFLCSSWFHQRCSWDGDTCHRFSELLPYHSNLSPARAVLHDSTWGY